MILPSDISTAVIAHWRSNPVMKSLVPGGLWIAGTIPSAAQAPYASMIVLESDSEVGSTYVIRRFELTITVWSDLALENAGEIAKALNDWLPLNLSLFKLPLPEGDVIRVRPGSADAEVLENPRLANDITVTRLRRRIVTEE